MLLREIALHRRYGETTNRKIYWKNAFLRFTDQKSLLVEKWVDNDYPSDTLWNLFLNLRWVNDYDITLPETGRVDHYELDEFTAQAVLDHYVTTFGVPKEVAPRRPNHRMTSASHWRYFTGASSGKAKHGQTALAGSMEILVRYGTRSINTSKRNLGDTAPKA